MPVVVSVVQFDNEEREVLGGGSADRATAAKTVGAELKTMVSDMFKHARDLSSTHPSREQLDDLIAEIEDLNRVLSVLPETDAVGEVRQASKGVRDIAQAALDSLPA